MEVETMLDMMPERIVRYTVPALTIVYCNASWAAGFHLTSDAVVGRTLDDFLTADEMVVLREHLQLLTPANLIIENGAHAPNDTGRWIDWVDRFIPAQAEGEADEVLAVGRDATERHAAELRLAENDARLRALLAESSDVILVLDEAAHIMFASAGMERMLGYEPETIVGTLVFDLIHPDDHARVLRSVVPTQPRAEGSVNILQYRGRHANGSWVWIESHGTKHVHTPGIEGYIINARDITARHQANERIEQASALLASVMGAAANEAIFVTDSSATIVAFSRGAEELLGYRAEEIVGLAHPSLFHEPAEVAGTANEMGITTDELFRTPPAHGRSIERQWTFIRRDGSTFHGALTVTARFDSDGVSCGFLYVASDITERRRRELELTTRATRDPLTGLPNRATLLDELAAAAQHRDWTTPGRVVLFLDLDGFKRVNDAHGHFAGDAVLAAVSRRLIANLRPVDLAARFGGDEFVVLFCPGTSRVDARTIAERIVSAIAEPVAFDAIEVTVGVSIGLSVSGAGVPTEALIRHADAAAYEAKRAGRGRLVEAR